MTAMMDQLPECVLTRIYEFLCIVGRLKFGCSSRTLRAHCHSRNSVVSDIRLACHITNAFAPVNCRDPLEKRRRMGRLLELRAWSSPPQERVVCSPLNHTFSRRLLCLACEWWEAAADRVQVDRAIADSDVSWNLIAGSHTGKVFPKKRLSTVDPRVLRVNAALQEVLLCARYRSRAFTYWPEIRASRTHLQDCCVMTKAQAHRYCSRLHKEPPIQFFTIKPGDKIPGLDEHFAAPDMQRELATAQLLASNDPDSFVERLMSDSHPVSHDSFTAVDERMETLGDGPSELRSWVDKLLHIFFKEMKSHLSTGLYTGVWHKWHTDRGYHELMLLHGEEGSLLLHLLRMA
eukprot:Gregarina_sp_Pseudo_9__1459@NODE_1982_length_1220_cov_3_119390_g1834_i0_p1_GENE_NODE_1982_length_1220_cov_3_119390_g1834_i0NODE_1982_length_1220_cov_3_119390_g1834_i0_p1_ORF_typecomplete_len347_score34_88Fbox/PF00646_33/0_049Fbox/PF00646_33/2_7e03_NODE_1982_length_1220_cov_3_119390_g1834_i0551095